MISQRSFFSISVPSSSCAFYLVVGLGLVHGGGGNRDDIVVVMDLARHRREAKVRDHGQLDIRQSKALIPLVPRLGLDLELVCIIDRNPIVEGKQGQWTPTIRLSHFMIHPLLVIIHTRNEAENLSIMKNGLRTLTFKRPLSR